jgi:hypothetical protein
MPPPENDDSQERPRAWAAAANRTVDVTSSIAASWAWPSVVEARSAPMLYSLEHECSSGRASSTFREVLVRLPRLPCWLPRSGGWRRTAQDPAQGQRTSAHIYSQLRSHGGFHSELARGAAREIFRWWLRPNLCSRRRGAPRAGAHAASERWRIGGRATLRLDLPVLNTARRRSGTVVNKGVDEDRHLAQAWSADHRLAAGAARA